MVSYHISRFENTLTVMQGWHLTACSHPLRMRYVRPILESSQIEHFAGLLARRGVGCRCSRHSHKKIRVAEPHHPHVPSYTGVA